ncbi:MAG: hypothetical protein AAF901_05580 [Bacteroidota bacterium]
MIKRLVVLLIIILSCQSNAQQGTASPYSFYGIGSLRFKGTVENRSMGGIGVYLDSIHINLKNPAAYVGKNVDAIPFEGESRPVKYAVAGSYTSLNLQNANTNEDASSYTFDYFALSVPMGKFGFGFGALPYTSVGYRLEDRNEDDNLDNRYSGEGGLNRVFAGLGYQITDKLSVGVDVNYNFGNIQNNAIAFLYDSDGNLLQFQSRENNRSDLSGLNFNIGLSYKTMITDKLELSATTTYAPESNLSSENERSFSTITINPLTGQEFAFNTIDADLSAEGLDNTDLTLPSRFTLGVGIGQPKHWFVGAEYTYQNTSAFDNPIFDIDNSNFENSSGIAIGGFFIPNYNSFTGYFKRVVYRAGFRYEGTGLNINNESINEFGISFGVGLPIGGLFPSNINVGFEYGQRGTTNQNLIKEDFISLNFSLSLNDRWFKKRKYN